jgi:serine/threonine protein kinase
VLSAGTKLGPYEIVAPLGAGGMGEVYRARDTTLNRDVAIKVLPDLFASDAERLARFTREAQTLASLNHLRRVGWSAHLSANCFRATASSRSLPAAASIKRCST